MESQFIVCCLATVTMVKSKLEKSVTNQWPWPNKWVWERHKRLVHNLFLQDLCQFHMFLRPWQLLPYCYHSNKDNRNVYFAIFDISLHLQYENQQVCQILMKSIKTFWSYWLLNTKMVLNISLFVHFCANFDIYPSFTKPFGTHTFYQGGGGGGGRIPLLSQKPFPHELEIL